MDAVTIGKIVGVGVGLLAIAGFLYRFSALQTTQTLEIKALQMDCKRMNETIEKTNCAQRPLEVCGMKIDRAVEKAENAEKKIKEQTGYNLQTESKLSNLDGKVTEGFKQMTAGMAIIQNAFLDIKAG